MPNKHHKRSTLPYSSSSLYIMTEEQTSPEAQEERRRFATLLLGGALIAYAAPFPVVLWQYLTAPAARRVVAEPNVLGNPATLFANTDAVFTKLGNKSVVVFAAEREQDVPRALNLRCTHAGCTVEWQPDKQKFVCHCHGGEFHADGSVATLPPTQPLERLLVKHEARGLVLYDIVLES
jgi:Rieske Fe-S protein